MKTAILHPWFLMRGGGERVVDILADVYPEADLYTLFLNPGMVSPKLLPRIRPSLLNAFPFSSRLHRQLLPLYPWAIESLDLREYDVVISSCGPAMMGCSVRQDATHICYCHTPQRSYWDLYAEHQLQLPPLLRHLFVVAAGWVRTWEFSAMQRVDHVISNSNYIAERVRKVFRRESVVIYPPVSMSTRPLSKAAGDYYLTVGRLEKQKRVDILIHACNLLGCKLVIAGTGKEDEYLRSIAGPTITFAGYASDETVRGLYAGCKAFLFAAVEDFGIAPVEAQAYGRPVIAYGFGGSLETVRVNDPDGRRDTGILFPEQTVDSLVNALRRFEANEMKFCPEANQEHARQFDTATFTQTFCDFVTNARKKDLSR
jgi:glycosyltransferase involved in cell wall biosynthesis